MSTSRLLQVATMPISTADERMAKIEGPIHESCFRAYQVNALVLDYLRQGVPSVVILEIVAHLDELQHRLRVQPAPP